MWCERSKKSTNHVSIIWKSCISLHAFLIFWKVLLINQCISFSGMQTLEDVFISIKEEKSIFFYDIFPTKCHSINVGDLPLSSLRSPFVLWLEYWITLLQNSLAEFSSIVKKFINHCTIELCVKCYKEQLCRGLENIN